MAVKGAKNKRMTSEEKEAKEARKAVVCNQPGTNPTMFYYTERCILKEDAHTYKRINRRAATFQKRADKEHQSIKEYSSALKFDSQKMNSLLMDARITSFRTKMLHDMVDAENMKQNTSPIRRYHRLFKDLDSPVKRYIEKKEIEVEVEKLVLFDVHHYFQSVSNSIYKFTASGE
jgi:hypothetical protein